MEQRRVHFEGMVQGVGFRYTACRLAGRFGLAGYVRNLPDGGVELVAEGQTDAIDAYLQDLSAAMQGYIRRQTQQKSSWSGAFKDFNVRY